MKLRSCLYSLILFLVSASAAQAQVVINEVFPNPSTGSEWVELYNPSDQAVMLNGWQLMDQLSTPSLLFTFTEQVIAAHSWLTVEITNKLNNLADGVDLYDHTHAHVDGMSYASSVTGQSWSRYPDGSGSFSLGSATPGSANTPSASPTPVPSASPSPSPNPSPLPTPSPLTTNLQLSEIMACPSDGDTEWLELYNPNPVTVTIEDWLVKDATGNLKTVNGVIPSQGYSSLGWSGSLLNNTGDSLSLVTPTQETIATAVLSKCTSGRSFVFVDGTWQETLTPSKNAANNLSKPHSVTPASPLPTSTVAELSLDEGLLPVALSSENLATSSSTRSNVDISAWLKPVSLQDLSTPSATLTELANPEKTSLSPEAPTPQPSNLGVASAIIGGVLLTTSSGFRLYETVKHLTLALG